MPWNDPLIDVSVDDILTETIMDELRENLEWEHAWSIQKPMIYDLCAGVSANYTTSTSFVKVDGSDLVLVPADIGSASTVYFEAIFRTDNASYAATVRLRVNGSEIASSQVSTTALGFTRVRSGDIAGSLAGTTAVTFDAVHAIANASARNYILGARLIVEQNP